MGFVDIHSHILPHMDDGARDMEETLKMLKIAWREGISHMIVTPHYKSGRFSADIERLQEKLRKVQQVAKEHNIPITLYAGNEIFYHSELEEKLRTGSLCTLNGSQRLLIEFSPFESYVYIRNAMEDVLGMGYIPVLAHVERYQCMCKDSRCVTELKAMGCEIQVNADSVAGGAWKMRRLVHRLLREELVDYIGTDAHNCGGRKPAMQKCAAYLFRKYGHSYAEALLHGNAEKYLNIGE